MDLVFTDTVGVDDKYAPKPATRLLPDWYKNTKEYRWDERTIRDGQTPHTIKKCIPVFDAMTAGYIIQTWVDVQITEHDGLPYYQWPGHDAISFHPIEQAENHPTNNGAPYPKWNNPWAIKTPRGYSALFVPPMHHTNNVFTIFPGIVDTDSYSAPVRFPFVLNDPKWTGLIPAGTPIAQVIPLKRDSFKMNIGGAKDIVAYNKTVNRLRSVWFNSYKRQFWNKKEYR